MAQEIVGSNPIARPIIHPLNNAPVAQWIEYLASNQGVAGSSPAGRTIFLGTKSPPISNQGAFSLVSMCKFYSMAVGGYVNTRASGF